MRRVLLLVCVVVALVVAAVGSAAPPSSYLAAASCDPCAVSEVVTFTGSGFAEWDRVMITVGQGTGVGYMSAYADAAGQVVFDWPYFSVSGSYTASFYLKRGSNFRLVSSVTVAVA